MKSTLRQNSADVGTQQARSLAATQDWKACPSCTNMVEESSGYLHMTFRCGTEFCYSYGELYRELVANVVDDSLKPFWGK